MAATSLVSMKTEVLVMILIVVLISPTLASRKVEEDAESPRTENSFFECPHLMKQNMTERLMEHVHASPRIKKLLRGSVKFVDCVAAKFCICVKLRFPPLIYGCFATVGGYCMAKVLRGHNIACALNCAAHITANNNQLLQLDDMSISNICFSKCANDRH